MSTLISELEEKPSLGDGDLVQNILKEMNGVGGLSPQQPHAMAPPPAGGASGVINAAMPNTAMAPRVMDPGPSQAHIIGGQHPTPGDFAAAMKGAGSLGGGPQPADSWGAGLAEYAPTPRPAPAPKPVAQKGWTRRILDEARTPLLVAMLVFLFSLPVVNFLFAHYIPWMVKASGELTAVGSLVKSLAAGITFWVLQRVVVPLLSL